MKKILLLLLLLPVSLFAQNQGGVIIVGGVAVHQPDTSAYKVINTIQAEGTQLNGNNRFYVTYLVALSKKDSLWQKSKAFYGFIGGTSASHKWNWKDMRDLDGAFRLTFPNGMTHSANGIQGNGTNQYANTFLNPAGMDNNISLSIYSTVNIAPNQAEATEMGTDQNNIRLQLKRTDGNTVVLLRNSSNNVMGRGGAPNKGYLLANTSLANKGVFLNGSYFPFTSSITNGIIASQQITLLTGEINSSTFFSNKTLGFAHIGSGLTDQQATQSSNIVTFAQGILGRK